MEEYVPPDVFYNGFRDFLYGPQLLNGCSAAQNSTFHAIDEFLGIKHAPSVEVFLAHQREYTSPKHRELILWL